MTLDNQRPHDEYDPHQNHHDVAATLKKVPDRFKNPVQATTCLSNAQWPLYLIYLLSGTAQFGIAERKLLFPTNPYNPELTRG
jgi:hypothetical protein